MPSAVPIRTDISAAELRRRAENVNRHGIGTQGNRIRANSDYLESFPDSPTLIVAVQASCLMRRPATPATTIFE